MSHHVRYIDITKIDSSLKNDLPYHIARKYCMLPVSTVDSDLMVVSDNGNSNEGNLEKAGIEINRKLVPYIKHKFSRAEIETAIEKFYGERPYRFGEILLMNDIVNSDQLAEALKLQRKSPNKRIGEVIKDLGYADENQLQKVLAKQIGYRYVELDISNFLDLTLIEKFPEYMIRRYKILPLPKDDHYEKILLLTSSRLEEKVLSEVKEKTGLTDVEPVVTSKQELEKAIESAYRRIEAFRARDVSLGNLLVEKNLISEDQLEEVLEEQRKKNVKLGELVIKKGLLPEKVVMEVVSQRIGVSYIPELPPLLDPQLKTIITARFASFNKLVPINMRDKILDVAMADPADRDLILTLRLALNKEIAPVLTTEREINRAIHQLYYADKDNGSSTRLDLKKKIELKFQEFGTLYNTERIINTVNNILVDAVSQDASDIHITPEENGVKLFYRIDGSLKEKNTFPLSDRDNIVTRIKIMSDMRIDTRFIPQSGRIVARISDKHIDFRVSTLPIQYGENVVMRILDGSKLTDSDFSKLGMPKEIEESFIDQIERPQGLILVTGPTGSGKTTTLYHALKNLQDTFPAKSISTIENPIEYIVDRVVQSEINEARGLTYARLLKEKLRQDPDIIMVGEIRNLEEGQIAFTAALTGHLILSTLHTSDGVTTIRRLVDMGVEPFNVSAGLNCILSQRLARRICHRCKIDYQTTEKEIKKIRASIPTFKPEDYQFKKGKGCNYCIDGYKGRLGIFELLQLDSDLKQIISSNASDSEIRKVAVEKGMKTLRTAGIELAAKGVTTITEILSVTDFML